MAEGIHYDADTDRYGNITIRQIATGKTVYLQGDDAADFRQEWEQVVDIWTRENGKDLHADAITYEKQFDLIADAYADVME